MIFLNVYFIGILCSLVSVLLVLSTIVIFLIF